MNCALIALATLYPSIAWSHNRGFAYKRIVETTSGFAGLAGFAQPTVVTIAPDGRLFFSQTNGKIFYATIDANFNVAVTPVPGMIPTIYDLGPVGKGRLVTGMAFGPNGDLFVSHSDVNPVTSTTSGAVTRLFASSNFATFSHVATGLPRSTESHAPNGLAFRPNTNLLYLAQGGMTNNGLPSPQFGGVSEMLESASVIEFDVVTLVQTRYATGFRNPYDLTWHSNNNLYLNDNGPNLHQGNATDNGTCNVGADVTQPDELNLVLLGHYYGHPNPTRGECIFNGGDQPIHRYDIISTSSDGIAEYTSAKLPGLTTRLVTANFGSGNIVAIQVSGSTASPTERILWKGLNLPLDVAVRASDGAIFIAEYGQQAISVLRVKRAAVMDYDGDGRSDFMTMSPTTGMWSERLTGPGTTLAPFGPFGGGTQVPYAIDFNGDGLADHASFDPLTGNWHIYGTAMIAVGSAGDVPVTGDLDGDGRTDLVAVTPSTSQWHEWRSSTGMVTTPGTFGGGSMVPFLVDVAGNGFSLPAAFDPATGIFNVAGAGANAVGSAGDVPLVGDLDGDGRTDLVAVTPSTSLWHEWLSSTGTVTTPGTFGGGSMVPYLVDVNGTGIDLPAAWDSSTGLWYVAGFGAPFALGSPGNVPIRVTPF